MVSLQESYNLQTR